MTMIFYGRLGIYILFFGIVVTGSDGKRFNGAMLNRIHHAKELYRFPSTSFEHCYRLCIYAKICESSNWLSPTGECQLYLRDPDSSGSTVFSDGSVHVSSFQVGIQRNPCSDEPCSSDHMCVPVTKATDYRCLRIFENVERQSDTSSSSPSSSEETSFTSLTTYSETSATTSPSTEATTSSTTTSSPSTTASPSTATTSQTTTSTTTSPSATTAIATQPRSCAIGFDLDRESGGCRSMKECAVFGTKFTCYQRHYIKDTNQKTHRTDQSNCEQKCLASTSFTCKSYETYYSYCYLQGVTWADVSEDLRKVTGGSAVQHCQRNCEWT